jgi:hypothetical protein
VVGVTSDAIRRLERDAETAGLVLGVRLAYHLSVHPLYLASGVGPGSSLSALHQRLEYLERLLEAKAADTSAPSGAFHGIAAITYDDEQRAATVRETISLYPSHLREIVSAAGIRVVLFPAVELFRQHSPYLRRRRFRADVSDEPPAGVFVLIERTLYLRDSSPKTVAHEYAHALDCALGGGVFLSHVSQPIRRAFRKAQRRGEFVTPYAAKNRQEYFAEGARSMVEVNDSRSAWPPVSRERLREVDPDLFGIMEALFDASAVIDRGAGLRQV